jgi:hypothetical protein
VELRLRCEEGRAHFAGLQTCGSVWSCPLCSSKILAGRAAEIGDAVERWYLDGGRVAMVTLTMRHRRGQRLAGLWDGLGEAWTAASRGNRSVRRALSDVAGWCRRVEVTSGDNGWHVHVHALLFVGGRTEQSDVDALGATMFEAWSTRLMGQGFDAPIASKGGLSAKLLDLTTAREDVAKYLAKGTFEALKPSRRAALEIAGATKRARRCNRTPMQLLEDVVAYGLVDDAALWWEFEQASQGRRSVTWSQGFRGRLGLDVELSDEQLAAETDRGGEVVALFSRDAWRAIARCPGAAAHVLGAAGDAGDASIALVIVEKWLAFRGLPPPDRVEVAA